MGKRRSLKQLNPDDRYKNDDDDDEDENELENQTEEPLKPEEVTKIQSRVKLIAKRRVADTAPSGFSFGGFGSAKPATGTGTGTTPSSMFGNSNHSASNGTSAPSETAGEKPAFAFSGFKGFSALPAPTAPTTTTTTSTSANGPASNFLFKPSTDTSGSSLLTAKPAPQAGTSLLSTPFGSGASANAESSTLKEKTNGNTNTTTTTSSSEISAAKNITETELTFINGLDELYKRCYSSSVKSRHYKLPIEVLNNSNIDSLGSEDDMKAKYAYLLAELNRNTSKWISKHVEESPLVILTPIFVDYFNYLILLEKQFFPEIFPKKTAPSQSMDTSSATTTTTASTFPVPFSDSRRGLEEKENNHGKPSFKLNGSEHTFVSNTANSQQQQSSTSLFFAKSNLSNTAAPSDSKPTAAIQLNGHNKSVSVSSTSSSLTSSGATMKIGDGDDDDDDEEDDDDDEVEEEQEDDDVQEIPSDDAKLAESSKTFAALIKSSSSSSSSAESGASNSKPLFGASLSKDAPAAAASSFKFGGATTPATAATADTFSLAQSTKLNFLSQPMTTSDAPALFTFGAKKEEKAEEAPPSSKTTTTPSGFFANLSKPAEEFKPFSTFSSASGPSATFGASSGASSLFGSLSKPQQATTDSTPAAAPAPAAESKPFFSFQSLATSKVEMPKPTAGGIFGNLPAAGTGGIFGGILGAGAGASSIFAAASANPIGGGGEGGEADDEPYEPPKPESSDVTEEGAVFTKRVKMFYFNGEKFCDRGIGNLYLKPTSSGEKTQLIVRADTKLATILLNINLSKSLPTSKAGAKDVSLLCLPNPPLSDPKIEANKPCKFLFKVKTESDADELNEKLNEHKK